MSATAVKTRRRRPSPRRFYRQALSEAERLELDAARQVEGLDEEIALLRLRLRRALVDHPEDMQLMTKGMELLVKAVAAKYRLPPRARRDLADNLAAVIENVGGLLLPEGLPNE
ncbi:MAG: hypothetical protein ACE5IZ_06375 [Dehalococcoidia bacterium]